MGVGVFHFKGLDVQTDDSIFLGESNIHLNLHKLYHLVNTLRTENLFKMFDKRICLSVPCNKYSVFISGIQFQPSTTSITTSRAIGSVCRPLSISDEFL